MNCSFCQNSCQIILKCSRCKQAQYCNETCQKSDWKKHKLNCEGPPRPPPNPISIDHFIILENIGEGNFSEIFKAKCKYRNQHFAIKRFTKYRLKQLNKDADVRMEVHCLEKLKGAHTTQIYHHWHDELYMYIVMDIFEYGDLLTLITQFGLPCENYAKFYGLQILAAMEYFQQNGIVHRDLKPENILLTQDKNLKIIDFGSARDVQDPTIKGSGNGRPGRQVFEHYVGTPQYMPIEMIRNQGSFFSSDVWSFGVILYQMICGDWPFKGGSEYLIFKQILETEVQFFEGIFSEEAQDLLKMILKKDHLERPTIEQIKNHVFFKDFQIQDGFKNIQISDLDKQIYKLRQLGKQQKFKEIQEINQFYDQQNIDFTDIYTKNKINWIKLRLIDINGLNNVTEKQEEKEKLDAKDLSSSSEDNNGSENSEN